MMLVLKYNILCLSISILRFSLKVVEQAQILKIVQVDGLQLLQLQTICLLLALIKIQVLHQVLPERYASVTLLIVADLGKQALDLVGDECFEGCWLDKMSLPSVEMTPSGVEAQDHILGQGEAQCRVFCQAWRKLASDEGFDLLRLLPH